MDFTIAITLKIDPDEWAREYDLTGSTEAVKDITEVLDRAATDGGIAEIITRNWGMMADAASVTAVAGPGKVLAAMAWSDTLAHAEVAAMSAEHREILARAIRGAESSEADAALLATIRATLTEMYGEGYPEVKVVTFGTMDFDDGNFFVDSSAEVHFNDATRDAETMEWPTDVDVDHLLTEAYGRVGPRAALAVNPHTGDTDVDDYGHQVMERAGIAA